MRNSIDWRQSTIITWHHSKLTKRNLFKEGWLSFCNSYFGRQTYFLLKFNLQDGTPTSKTFAHLPSEIGAEEAEEVGVEHLLRYPFSASFILFLAPWGRCYMVVTTVFFKRLRLQKDKFCSKRSVKSVYFS